MAISYIWLGEYCQAASYWLGRYYQAAECETLVVVKLPSSHLWLWRNYQAASNLKWLWLNSLHLPSSQPFKPQAKVNSWIGCGTHVKQPVHSPGNHYKNPEYNYQKNGYSGKHTIMLQKANCNMMPGGKSRQKCESHCQKFKKSSIFKKL